MDEYEYCGEKINYSKDFSNCLLFVWKCGISSSTCLFLKPLYVVVSFGPLKCPHNVCVVVIKTCTHHANDVVCTCFVLLEHGFKILTSEILKEMQSTVVMCLYKRYLLQLIHLWW